MKILAFCLLLGSLGAAFAMDRVAAQTVPATGAQLVTLGTAGGPFPRANRAQSSNLLVVNGIGSDCEGFDEVLTATSA